MLTNIYLDLTREFNHDHIRCVVSSGQAVVLHHLAIMSKDGDWIVRENQSDLDYVLSVLERHGARYRFGAPLDVEWLAGGWSAHFEFAHQETTPLRIRTDFVTRPPRLTPDDLAALWRLQGQMALNEMAPVINKRQLALIKQTNRERDYAVIGELARHMDDLRDRFLFSRSATDLLEMAEANPILAESLVRSRPVLAVLKNGREALEVALDAERRELMHTNERRLRKYAVAAENWLRAWRQVEQTLDGLPLREAHRIMVERATSLLPTHPLQAATDAE